MATTTGGPYDEIGGSGPLAALIGDLRPEEMYNLAGESSVADSFADPRATWETNAYVVVHLLDAIRRDSPGTRFYQASSGEMFGCLAGGEVIHDETSPLNPQSPYAAAKAAAHLLCRSYRESYGLRIACGILSNHESRRRGAPFLSRKVIDHVETLRDGAPEPLRVGNLKARRDWGFAPDYVEGMIMVLRQASLRRVRDVSSEYRDYVLGTGHLYCVWELIDRAFFLAGFELDWGPRRRESRSVASEFSRFGHSGCRSRSRIRPSRRSCRNRSESRSCTS